MNQITDWIEDIFIIILSISFIEIMLPDSSMKKYIKFIYSIMIMAVILEPLNYFFA